MSEKKPEQLGKTVRKHAGRAKERILQNLGKADKTVDEVFDDYVHCFTRQHNQANRLQKEISNYLRCVKNIQLASKSLMDTVCDMYETEWLSRDQLLEHASQLEAVYIDYCHKLYYRVVEPIDTYTSQFTDVRRKIDKRGRKLVDYDSHRHAYEALQCNPRKRDQAKLDRQHQLLVDSKSTFESLNGELYDELPALFDSRLPFLVSSLQNFVFIESNFLTNASKVHTDLESVMETLHKESTSGRYTTRRKCPKSPKSPVGIVSAPSIAPISNESQLGCPSCSTSSTTSPSSSNSSLTGYSCNRTTDDGESDVTQQLNNKSSAQQSYQLRDTQRNIVSHLKSIVTKGISSVHDSFNGMNIKSGNSARNGKTTIVTLNASNSSIESNEDAERNQCELSFLSRHKNDTLVCDNSSTPRIDSDIEQQYDDMSQFESHKSMHIISSCDVENTTDTPKTRILLKSGTLSTLDDSIKSISDKSIDIERTSSGVYDDALSRMVASSDSSEKSVSECEYLCAEDTGIQESLVVDLKSYHQQSNQSNINQCELMKSLGPDSDCGGCCDVSNGISNQDHTSDKDLRHTKAQTLSKITDTVRTVSSTSTKTNCTVVSSGEHSSGLQSAVSQAANVLTSSSMAAHAEPFSDGDSMKTSAAAKLNGFATFTDIPAGASTHNLPPGVLYRVQVMYTYQAEDTDELSLDVGEILNVVAYDNPDDQEAGWLVGIKVNDQSVKGLFPANFTCPI